MAKQLGHTVVDPQPSLFTFKVDDKNLQSLAGVSILVNLTPSQTVILLPSERDVMVWSIAPKHQRSGLLCEERESRESSAENGEETLAAKVPLSLERFWDQFSLISNF